MAKVKQPSQKDLIEGKKKWPNGYTLEDTVPLPDYGNSKPIHPVPKKSKTAKKKA